MSIFKRLGWFFKQEKRAYISGVFMLFLIAILQTLNPYLIGKVVDEIASDHMMVNMVIIFITILGVSGIFQYLFRYYWRVKIFGTSAKLEKILRQRLYKHFTEMDAQFYQEHRTGDLMAHATNDLNAIRLVAGQGILTLADSLFTGGATLISMFLFVDWRLTLVAMLPLPFLILSSQKIGHKIHQGFRRAQASFSAMNSKVQESVSGVRVIKTFGEESLDIDDFKRVTNDVVKANMSVTKYDAMFNPNINLFTGISYAITIVMGGMLVTNNELSIGSLVAFISYVGMMIWPMLAVGQLYNLLERGNASYDRIVNLFDQSSHIYKADNGKKSGIASDWHIAINRFCYPDAQQAVLKDIDFNLKNGQTIGIVGKTGSGKSTLFKLLLREYDQFTGSIRVGGVSIRDFDMDYYLKSIGYVPQDNFLFSTTIAENIKFADPTLSEEKVRYAAKLADIDENILELPEGYQTLVGERGVSLSGGQKQRISIARALVTDPELLILDDSLSAVDAKTEQKILSNLKDVRQNKSTIISAHRMSSVMDADLILVLDNGLIQEVGTHDQLMANQGWYYRMYEKQKLEQHLEGGQL
ncbi:MAG TPA: multidrug ABC transporter permease/ATP-binding protein [Bavariicoccus seileri]|uniref:Multidrug ABC transporter permease/ATP-binding protein n=1 Tax=Bavariicoccus seileri TaxID=549685 RepID=A0A3D4S3B3_9ENTE|nr:ABC transporter transmembrane domain-containing protein [Bavariicoccus seileri]HCS93314.1 multidrug ABC transporter permease/ATP-binding protein [Bavariicoccus seileri]